MVKVVELSKVRLETAWDIGVHISKEEDNIIFKDAGWLLQANFFYLKCIFMYFLDVSDAIRDKLLSFFELASNKD